MDNQEPHINADPPKTSNMRKNIALLGYLILVILVVVVVAVVHNHKPTSKVATENNVSAIASAKVSISASGFVPQTITVNINQAVTWTNNDKSEHQIASDPYPKDNTLAGLNSKTPIMPGHTYSYVFTHAGTYLYHDDLNPYTLKGTVIVK